MSKNIAVQSNEKYCRTGQHILDKSMFSNDNAKKDGLSSYCKDCKSKKFREYYQTHKHDKWEVDYNVKQKERYRKTKAKKKN